MLYSYYKLFVSKPATFTKSSPSPLSIYKLYEIMGSYTAVIYGN